MKKIEIFVILLMTSMSVHAQYYYSYETKIPLQNTEIILVSNSKLDSFGINVKTLGDSILYQNAQYSIIAGGNIKSTGCKYYPVYQLSDGELIGYLDEIVFALKSNV